VIWNLVRRSNLACMHCYSISADIDFPGELSTPEVLGVMEDLKAFGVPALILSGGEPLLRPDLFEIAQRAKALGFYTALSTNGTLIDPVLAARIAATGFDCLQVIGKQTLFDARTLAEVKRVPMKKPVGKYNGHNKVMRSEGTSP